MRSVIRWAGSKRKLLPVLSGYVPRNCTRYLEPFAGSAALFFHVEPPIALLNDNNRELVSALRQLRRRPSEIYRQVVQLPRTSAEYYRQRSTKRSALDAAGAAVRFFFLNRHCFNGIYRTNKQGEFNVPFATSRSGAIPDRDEWMRVAKALSQAQLYSEDFESFCIREARDGDFVYLDPPYAVSNRRMFRQYSANTFGLEDMQRLSVLLRELDRRGVKFLVSYALSPEGRQLARTWHVTKVRTLRNVAGFHFDRRRAFEVLISNFRPECKDAH